MQNIKQSIDNRRDYHFSRLSSEIEFSLIIQTSEKLVANNRTFVTKAYLSLNGLQLPYLLRSFLMSVCE